MEMVGLIDWREGRRVTRACLSHHRIMGNKQPIRPQIAWNDPANPSVGFKYLYLSPEDYEVSVFIHTCMYVCTCVYVCENMCVCIHEGMCGTDRHTCTHHPWLHPPHRHSIPTNTLQSTYEQGLKPGTVNAQLVEEDGEKRYALSDIIGQVRCLL